MNPQKDIRFSIDTIENMMFNHKHIQVYFEFLENLVKDGFELSFYRIGSEECLTTIRDLNHLNNFRRSFKFIKD